MLYQLSRDQRSSSSKEEEYIFPLSKNMELRIRCSLRFSSSILYSRKIDNKGNESAWSTEGELKLCPIQGLELVLTDKSKLSFDDVLSVLPSDRLSIVFRFAYQLCCKNRTKRTASGIAVPIGISDSDFNAVCLENLSDLLEIYSHISRLSVKTQWRPRIDRFNALTTPDPVVTTPTPDPVVTTPTPDPVVTVSSRRNK